jgi:hypothetical protein
MFNTQTTTNKQLHLLKITPKMREMPFQRHKKIKNREGATACPQTHKEMPGFRLK